MSVERTTKMLMQQAMRAEGPLVGSPGNSNTEYDASSASPDVVDETSVENVDDFDKELRLSMAAQNAGAQTVGRTVKPVFRHGPEEYLG